jgi:hypothetical protein
MSGIPQFNFPLFDSECERLRGLGWYILSPHEQDSPEVQAEARASKDGLLVGGKIAGETWGEILARDVRLVSDEVVGVLVLPNWYNSRGARLETFVAHLCNKPILYAAGFGQVPAYQLTQAWSTGLNLDSLGGYRL